MPNVTIAQAFEAALRHHQAGRLPEAEALYRQILAAEPNHADALHFLGVIAHQAGRHDLAVDLIRRSIALDPNDASSHSNLGMAYATLGRLEEAIASCRRALALKEDYPEAHNNLGNALRDLGQYEEAITAYHRALDLQPGYAEAHSNLASSLVETRRFDEALARCRRALELNPKLPEAYNNLGNALKNLGRREEAIAAYRRALELKPDLAEACNNLGVVLAGLGQTEKALAAYRRALELRPNYPDALSNMGGVFKDQGQLDEAETIYRCALALQPDYADAHNNLGSVLGDRGQLDEAIAAYRRALEFEPEGTGVHSNLIYALHFHPGLERKTIVEEKRRWNRQFSDPLAVSILPHTNDRNPERRLRIGYVSPDFRDHAVAFFLAPLLEAHDHERFEIYGYSSVAQADAVTERLRPEMDVWREVRYLSDTQLSERIREDGIDILVDLTLHTAGNRLVVFARKPAPVQVSWLGYPGSAGVEAIGYRFSDARIDPETVAPEGADLKQIVRLPDAWCCYAPIAEFPPVGALPAANGRGVTFGSLNQFAKTNEALFACWAGLLRALPDARLLMICPAGQAQERTLRQFAEQGVNSQRLELVAPGPWEKYIRLYERIDIALDTYPCNGMTTTCHALWMGLPMITRAGESAVSRASLSLLHTLGLQELAVQSEEEYVRIAVDLAGDLARLAELRATLRPGMAASPLMDAPRFARNIEAAYRTLWRQWCQEEKAR